MTEKTALDGKVYLTLEKRISKGRDEAVAGTHLDRKFKLKMGSSSADVRACNTH